ncbi:MAG: serine endopeptidase [Methylophilaceae bacterium 17-44-8]|jgi:hypothetical protein|nr:MAG: serine endopeptidase [Methylophilales bacterium 28-44-11]OZA06039.1 MAG: serine endopeptidase [Methylophilaceae bacterium 17-44-8]
MSKAARLSEKWFNRALWLVAFVFAWFLLGLGTAIIRDLPHVEQTYSIEDFVDHATIDPLRAQLETLQQQHTETNDKLDQAQLTLNTRRNDYQAMRRTFENWLATRDVTQQNQQDDELVGRTATLDQLKALERDAEKAVETLSKKQLDQNQAENKIRTQVNQLENDASQALYNANQKQSTRVFLYRLLLALPLLALAGWMFAKKRKTPYWPFVWGFIIFALITFFVELVPYLPDYGGYVRYLVGIVITVLGGKYAISALQTYLEKQKLAESQPQLLRREELNYDTALTLLNKGVCPGCERGIDLKDTRNDFCQHCGIGLHNKCNACGARKSAFSKFCQGCGASASV